MTATKLLPILSASGLEFLRSHEGFRSHLYDDVNGHATIGYGHLVHKGRVGTLPNLERSYVNGIDKITGTALLAQDSSAAQAAVRTWVRCPLQQHEFDALVSFTFNVGSGALSTSTLARRVNAAAAPDAIEEAFMMWNKPPQIIGRRRAEAELFLRGNYGPRAVRV